MMFSSQLTQVLNIHTIAIIVYNIIRISKMRRWKPLKKRREKCR